MELFLYTPLAKPKITLKNDFTLMGKNCTQKYNSSPSRRIINAKYFFKDLGTFRQCEKFFMRQEGRKGSFFIPSWQRDFSVIKDSKTATNFIHVKKSNYIFWLFNQKRYIYIKSQNFTAQIIDIEMNEDSEILILNKEIKINKDSEISELICVRFNQDTIEFEKPSAVGYYTDLSFKEIIQDVI